MTCCIDGVIDPHAFSLFIDGREYYFCGNCCEVYNQLFKAIQEGEDAKNALLKVIEENVSQKLKATA